jgi:hypothetical protein
MSSREVTDHIPRTRFALANLRLSRRCRTVPIMRHAQGPWAHWQASKPTAAAARVVQDCLAVP